MLTRSMPATTAAPPPPRIVPATPPIPAPVASNELGSREEGETRVAELNARFTALGEDFADGLIDRETMRAGTGRVRANIAATELKMAQREVLIDLPEPLAEDIVKWWEEADKRRRRDFVSIVVDHLTVKPTDRRGHDGLDPHRVDYVWKTQ